VCRAKPKVSYSQVCHTNKSDDFSSAQTLCAFNDPIISSELFSTFLMKFLHVMTRTENSHIISTLYLGMGVI